MPPRNINGTALKWSGGKNDVRFRKSWAKFPEDYIITVKPMIGCCKNPHAKMKAVGDWLKMWLTFQ